MTPTDDAQRVGDDAQDAVPAETELKFIVTPADLRRLTAHPLFAIAPVKQRLTSVYYDTTAFDLHKSKVSLRVRRVARRYVQTIKQARSGDVFDRDEWETPVRRQAFDAKAFEATPVAKLLHKIDGAIVPVFRTTFTREVRTWTQGGATIEVALDRGKVQAGEAALPLTELELELKQGEAPALYALARELSALAPIRLSLTSKSERGYRLLSPGVTSKAAKIALRPGMSVSEAFSAIAHACLVQVMEAGEAYRRDGGAEGVHQMRVGLRRLRTALKIFESVVHDGRSAFVEAEARWLADELGDARGLDVFIAEAFEPRAGALHDPVAARRMGERLRAARTAAHARAAAAVVSTRYAQLTLEIALWIEDGDWRTPASEKRRQALAADIDSFSAAALEEMRKTVLKRAKGVEKQDPPERHRLRIRAKRMRYAADFFCLLYSDGEAAKRQRRFIAALKPLQAALGKLNDIAMAPSAAMAPLGRRPSPQLVFAAGELVGRLQQQHDKQLALAADGVERFKDAKRFWPKPEKEQAPPD